MINETFWFFYLVELVNRVSIIGGVLMVASAFGIVVALMVYEDAYGDDVKTALKWMKRSLVVLILSTIVTVFTPTEKAFYGGTAQYVVEIAEVDDTLLALKELIDEKIGVEKDD